MSVGIAGRYLQDVPVISAERMKPKLENLDPIKGFERVFGEVAIANFIKGILKLVIVGAAVLWALWPRDGTLETLAFLDPAAFFAVVQERAGALMMACLIAFFLVAAVDYVYQREQFMKRQRMSKEEVKREFKENEGDPMLKAKIRQIRMNRASMRMMQNVQNATVVVTNPTHYAVALKYDREETPAPVCLAKGVDDVALKIREIAEEYDIPIIEEPPLARALFASAELDQPIPRQHYEAVAKIISLVLRLAQRRRPVPSRPNRPL
jgi:flagellar biosynthetic protein FlhB